MSIFMIMLVIGVTVPGVSLVLSFIHNSLEGLFNIHGGFDSHNLDGFDLGDTDLDGVGCDVGGDFDLGNLDTGWSGHYGDKIYNGHSDADTGRDWARISLFPLSPLLWCSMLVVTGSIGETMIRLTNTPLMFIWLLALPVGYIIMLLLYNGLMLPMRRARNFANSINDILGQKAVVIETIPVGGLGAVQVTGRSGRVIYAAQSADQGGIVQGSEVRIVKFNNHRAVVAIDVKI